MLIKSTNLTAVKHWEHEPINWQEEININLVSKIKENQLNIRRGFGFSLKKEHRCAASIKIR